MEEEIKYVYFQDTIDNNTVSELVDKISSCTSKINLYFSTEGGLTNPMFFLIDYLNSIKDRVTVTLTDEVLSAGTFILAYFEGKIKIDKNLDIVMFHVADRLGYRFRKEQGGIDLKELDKQTRKSNKEFIDIIKNKGLISEKQYKEYLKGKDVFIYPKQFLKWNIGNIKVKK